MVGASFISLAAVEMHCVLCTNAMHDLCWALCLRLSWTATCEERLRCAPGTWQLCGIRRLADALLVLVGSGMPGGSSTRAAAQSSAAGTVL